MVWSYFYFGRRQDDGGTLLCSKFRLQLKNRTKLQWFGPVFISGRNLVHSSQGITFIMAAPTRYDDLTARRAKLAFDTRILKREKMIEDCWTTFGKVMVKTTTNLIKEIKSQADLQNI